MCWFSAESRGGALHSLVPRAGRPVLVVISFETSPGKGCSRMIKTHSVIVLLAGASFMSAVLNAQPRVERDVSPLRNWAAPLYWQPTEAEAYAIDAGSRAPRSRASAAVAAGTAQALVFVAMT